MIEVGGGCGRGEALNARPDRHRDHVLLQALVVANAGVTPGRQQIDEAIVSDYFQPDLGIRGEKRRNDRRLHQAHGTDRDVETQRSCRTVAKAVHHIERGVDLVQRRPEALEQALPCLGRDDASGRPVEQPDPELCFQPPHRFAEPGSATAARSRPIAKALRTAPPRGRHSGHPGRFPLFASPHSPCGF